MRHATILAVLALVFASCSPQTGTYRWVDNPKKFVSLKSIVIAPHEYSSFTLQFSDVLDETVDTSLINGLSRRGFFDKIDSDPAIPTLETARAQGHDAILYCELDLWAKPFTHLLIHVGTAYSSIVTLTLVSTIDSSRIMYARYNGGKVVEDRDFNDEDFNGATSAGIQNAIEMLARSYKESK